MQEHTNSVMLTSLEGKIDKILSRYGDDLARINRSFKGVSSQISLFDNALEVDEVVEIKYDLNMGVVNWNGKRIQMPLEDYLVLKVLAEHRKQGLSSPEIIKKLKGHVSEDVDESYLATAIVRLRKQGFIIQTPKTQSGSTFAPPIYRFIDYNKLRDAAL